MLDRARSIANQIVQWRRHIHRHPELSFQEFETARFIAQALRDMGIDVQTGVGKTGVVGRLGSGKPVIALRADMDALPVLEETGLSFSSVNEGVMHACGHDTHIACLLGAAKLLAETPPPRGEVRFLFQPAEETVDDEEQSGAMRMADEGAIDGVDAIFGLHNWPEIEVGKVALSAGPQMASAGKFTARIRGRGGHGASPHQTVDPVVLAAQAVLALQTIVSRRLDPIDTGVVTVGSIHGGTRDNIIPEYVDLVGTLRSLRTEVYEQLKREVTRALGIARALGGDFEVEFHKSFPVTYNDSQMTALVTEVAQEMLGAEQVLPAEPTMGGEDFSVFAQRVPGCFMRLGAGFPGQPLRNHHDPHFDVDESALPIGAAMLAQVAVRYLSNSE
jgi:amidohydrolase